MKDIFVRPEMALVFNPNGMCRVAAGRRTMHLQQSSAVDGRRPKTHHRAEPARERFLDFHLAQVPGVPVAPIEIITPEREARR